MKPQDLQTLALAALTAPTLTRNNTAEQLAAKVDRLGLIRASLDALAKEADEIRDDLEATGLQHIEGTLYKAGFTNCKGRQITNWQAIAQRLGASPQLIRAHTKQGADSVRLMLTAKPRH